MNKSEQKKYRWAELKKLSKLRSSKYRGIQEGILLLLCQGTNLCYNENQYAQRKGFYL